MNQNLAKRVPLGLDDPNTANYVHWCYGGSDENDRANGCSHSGDDDENNLIAFCSRCHSSVHKPHQSKMRQSPSAAR